MEFEKIVWVCDPEFPLLVLKVGSEDDGKSGAIDFGIVYTPTGEVHPLYDKSIFVQYELRNDVSILFGE